MVGTEIGNYRILEKLGEGGMGVVYKAVDVNLDRVVAIKALNTELSGNPELEERFRAEAKAQGNLSHTNLATLFALLIENGRPWMVMEFIEGETFEHMVQRRGPIPSEEAIPLFRQALLGIGYAHRMGIVHRDIKPANMMLNNHGIVKVMDFGLAKVLGARRVTRTGTQIGTAFYMSPEQVLNRAVDVRSDIYSLGVTLYEMLTANVPFNADSDYQVMTDHVNAPPPLLTRFYPYVPKDLEHAVLRALEKNPADRFQSVEEFGAALAGSPSVVPAPVPAPDQRTVVPAGSRFVFTRERQIIAAGMLAILALAGVLLAGRLGARWPSLPLFAHNKSAPIPIPANNIVPVPPPVPANPADGVAVAPAQPDAGVAPAAPALVIPAGTVVAVRMIEGVNSSVNQAGQRFAAHVDAPVIVNGAVAISAGAAARVALISVAQAPPAARTDVRLELVRLSINGATYRARTSIFEQLGIPFEKKHAAVGAAVGAAIGGIFGHKKGAADGAVAGAASPFAVNIAPQTRIVFTLRDDITVSQ
jgi:serine/threonine-protein kinase